MSWGSYGISSGANDFEVSSALQRSCGQSNHHLSYGLRLAGPSGLTVKGHLGDDLQPTFLVAFDMGYPLRRWVLDIYWIER